MKSKYPQDQQLFERLQESPTELSLVQVTAIIERLPVLHLEHKAKNNWTRFFNFKNIIIMSISLFIAIGIFVLAPTTEKSAESTEAIQQPIEAETFLSETQKTVTIVDAKTNKKIFSESVQQSKEPLVKTQIPKEKSNISLVQKNIVLKEKEELLLKDSPKRTSKKVERLGTNIPDVVMLNDPTPLPELSGAALKRIKRSLYKNLKNDGIIASSAIPLDIALSGNKIVVNGKKIEDHLFIKYNALTKKVGTGPNRKIVITESYIKAGDFSETGFKGSGVGTFMKEEILSDEEREAKSEKEKLDLALKTEREELNVFAQEIFAENPPRKKRMSLFQVNISYKKIAQLHQELYRELVKDQLLNSNKDFVLIELPKSEILLNGKTLAPTLQSKYKKIFSDYKIKSHALRQIRMSEHSIAVGDYLPGKFRGVFYVIR